VHNIRWWEAAIAVGAIGAVSLADRRVDDWVQGRRSSRSDDIARVFHYGGEPQIVFGVPGAILAAGFVGGSKHLQRSGGRVLASVVAAGLATGALKETTGRFRPDETTDQYVFRPFSNRDAFPSGHSTMAFALATSLSAEIHRPWATALLYAGATGTAWSRLNDHKHWLSDVLAGAAVGITAGSVIEGRWRIFGLGPPQFLGSPGGARLEWRVAF
jgi:membrane-associated phospholipid phosphatase